MSANILLVCPNRQKFVHPVPPIGALYLAAILRSKGHNVSLIDMMFSGDPAADLASALKRASPDIVGISIRNTDTLFSKELSEMPDLKKFVGIIKSLTRARILLGGAGYSFFAEEILMDLEADYGIQGEADRSLPSLVERIESGASPDDIPGLVRFEDGKVVSNPPDVVDDLDSIPPQAIDLIDFRMYGKRRGNMGVFTRKGCPMECIYCPEERIHGRVPRLRSAEVVCDEIDYMLKKTSMPYFDFADTLFNVPRAHAMKVCEEIVRRGLKIKFEVELNPVGQDEESVRLLKAAGCVGVDLTTDTGSEKMLKNLKKGFTAGMLNDTARLYQKHGIPYTVGFLLGGPGEDAKTLDESIRFAESLPGVTSFYFGVGIRMFKGTELARDHSNPEHRVGDRKQRGGDDLHDLCFYLSPDFDDACAERLKDFYLKDKRCYICDLLYEGEQLRAMKLADRMNVRPIWKHGKFPRYFELLMHLGRSPKVAWDARLRRFTSG